MYDARLPIRYLFALVVALAVGTAVGTTQPAVGQEREMASYYEQARFLEAPASVFREGLLGFANPAAPSFSDGQLVGAWTTPYDRDRFVDDWGVFAGGNGLGLGLVREREPVRNRRGGRLRTLTATGANVSLAGGSERFGVGVGYQWWYGDASALGRYNRVTLGAIARPVKYLSVGAASYLSVENDEREVVGSVGVRPLGTARITLFGDAAWDGGTNRENWSYSGGATVEVVRGVDLVGRVFEDDRFTAGLRVEFGRMGLGSQVDARDRPGQEDAQINRVRLGTDVGSAIGDAVRAGGNHVEVAPKSAPYRAPALVLSGEEAPRFYEVLRTLRQAATNDRVAAAAIDLRDLNVSREKAWELRRAARAVQNAGKKVVAFVRNGSMNTYHLASVADRVVIDPKGTLILPGYATSRTFLKTTLDKVGLGVQTFRYLEYKSAFETFSRSGFSEADSLQRQQLVNDWYDLTRRDVADARALAPDSVDRIIDERYVLDAREARDVGLADTLARWHERDGILEDVVGEETRSLGAGRLDDLETASRRWGARPEIAVVYGIGSTSLESGIEAEKLAERFRDLAEDDRVEAVVFRVDSPGGSALAADLVAQAVKKCAEKKPVIVSQGTVAASGGYLISTYADRILAGPNTVTGSIGVIGLWFYDDGLLSEKAGFDYDVVQKGEKADLLAPYQLPFVGLPVPQRKLSEDELERVRRLILRSYDDFVAQVAAGRDTTESYVRSVAEGRVYTGVDGKAKALVDEIGGLARAVVVARSEAGLAGEPVHVREVNPTTGFLDLPDLLPFGLGALLDTDRQEDPTSDAARQFVRTVLETQPRPLMLLPPGLY
jgi:protease-4